MSSVKLTAPSGYQFEQPTGLFINNEFVSAKKGETAPAVDPATGEEITKVQAATEEDVDVAVAAARKAYKETWKYTDGATRGRLLNKLADLIERDLELLTTIEAWDGGKAYDAQAKPNIMACIACVRYYAGYADKLGGKTIEPSNGRMGYTLREPLGVCAKILPFNFPILMAAWSWGPALASGNCLIMKPSEYTMLSLLHLGNLFKEAGFPPGVVSILNGSGKQAGAALASHMDVDKISFTGSTATGKVIAKLAASNLKNVTLECGGKSPMIVFEDADLKKAVREAHLSLMANQGQICTALGRYYVHEKVHDAFVEEYVRYIKEVSNVAKPFDKGSFHGPQISDVQHKKVLNYIESGKSEGGRVVIGGEQPQGLGNGYFVQPTLFADVKDEMTIMKEEIFGPVGAIAKFSDEKDVVARANDTQYGLGACVFTQDLSRATRVAAELEAGQVWINTGNTPDFRMPFGGYKSSGIGRDLSESAFESYTQVKAVHIGFESKI